MATRHEIIGIKQAIRVEWMEKTVNLILAGLEANAIRQELHEFFVGTQETDGSERSKNTRTFLVNNLMRVWVDPDQELIAFRDAAIDLLRKSSNNAIPIHWAMISAVYPFWFNVARQTGRLLSLQDQVTQMQIINRMKEQYGDRQTISRYAKYVIRSFIAWGVLTDTGSKGCYAKSPKIQIDQADRAALVYESVLLAEQIPKIAISLVQSNPALFPFAIQSMTGVRFSQLSKRVDVSRYGLDDELLVLVTEKGAH
jgi:HAMP domain-containing protein